MGKEAELISDMNEAEIKGIKDINQYLADDKEDKEDFMPSESATKISEVATTEDEKELPGKEETAQSAANVLEKPTTEIKQEDLSDSKDKEDPQQLKSEAKVNEEPTKKEEYIKIDDKKDTSSVVDKEEPNSKEMEAAKLSEFVEKEIKEPISENKEAKSIDNEEPEIKETKLSSNEDIKDTKPSVADEKKADQSLETVVKVNEEPITEIKEAVETQSSVAEKKEPSVEESVVEEPTTVTKAIPVPIGIAEPTIESEKVELTATIQKEQENKEKEQLTVSEDPKDVKASEAEHKTKDKEVAQTSVSIVNDNEATIATIPMAESPVKDDRVDSDIELTNTILNELENKEKAKLTVSEDDTEVIEGQAKTTELIVSKDTKDVKASEAEHKTNEDEVAQPSESIVNDNEATIATIPMAELPVKEDKRDSKVELTNTIQNEHENEEKAHLTVSEDIANIIEGQAKIAELIVSEDQKDNKAPEAELKTKENEVAQPSESIIATISTIPKAESLVKDPKDIIDSKAENEEHKTKENEVAQPSESIVNNNEASIAELKKVESPVKEDTKDAKPFIVDDGKETKVLTAESLDSITKEVKDAIS